MNARRLIEILREDLAYFNGRVIGADAPIYPFWEAKEVQDTSCRGFGGVLQFLKVPQDWGI